MANDIDKTSPHYKGEFGSIYEVSQKFPNGGVAGDYVEIDGWAHYWNADRGTWCVNAQRDSYWDELLTNLTAALKLMRGASYMGMATSSTQPDDSLVKRFYFAKEAGTYSHFGNISVPQGISILYSSNGKQWILQNLLEISQGLGDSTTKVVSQKTLKDELCKKADASELAKKANIESVDEIVRQINGKFSTQELKINKKANADEVNNVVRNLRLKDSELGKKLDQKAEQSAVNAGMRQLSSEVARKADKETVNASLDLKANKRDVVKTNAAQNAEISRKANQQDVERSLNILRKEIGERTVVEGDVNNNPDEEDLTSKMGSNNRAVLSLKDREYNPLEFSGKGYKILRKNLQEVTCAITKIQVTKVPATDGYVSFIINGVETHVDLVASTDNTVALVAKKIADRLSETMDEYVTSIDGALVTCTRRFGGDVTSSSFSSVNTGTEAAVSESSKTELRNLLTAAMINQPNTIYEIRYDFDLNGSTIFIPDNVTLSYKGGTINNGKIFSNNRDTRIENPPKMTDWLNSVYWGRFWDVNNNELTYRFDPINRPFSISLNCNREEDITTIRLKGVTETEYWIELDVTSAGFELPEQRMNNMLLYKNKYNWSPKHIRMQNNRFKHAENSKGYVTDNVANNDSEKFIQPYYETTCTLIDWISKNFPLCEAIFFDNEDRWAYNNQNWLNCYIRLAKYAETKGMLGSVVHNSFMCNENRLSIHNIGLNNRVNSDNFKIFGANIYPLTVANTRLKLSTCNLFNDSHKKVLHTFISDAVYEIMQFRGFPYLYITEGGFGQSSVGAYSNVDETYDKYGNSNYHEASKSATFEVFREWLSLLASHATFIKHYNLWGLNGPRGTSVYGRDSDLVKRDCELYYNLLLNF